MKITEKRKIGDIGEDVACKYLIDNRYRVLERNHRERFGEIDVVARDKEGMLVFIEVKTLKEARGAAIIPEDNMTYAKMKKTRRICEAFANAHPELINEKLGWRIDLIAVTLPHDLTKNKKDCTIKHYENI